MDDAVRALLDGANFAHLATTLPDGAPHSSPVWILLDGDRLYFFTQTGNRKARNVERDGRVAMSVLDRENPYRQAWLRGRVVERRDDAGIWETIDRMAVKYTGEPFPFRPATSVLYGVDVERAGVTELPF